MATVYLTSTNAAAIAGDWWTDLARLQRSASLSAAASHRLAATPATADIILFSDSRSSTQADVRANEIARAYPGRVFVYDCLDRVVPVLPGVYTATESRWYLPFHMRAGYYVKIIDHDWIQPSPVDG